MNSYYTTTIAEHFSAEGFTPEQIAKVQGHGSQKVYTLIELWAHWFTKNGLDIDELVKERSIKDDKLISMLKSTMYKMYNYSKPYIYRAVSELLCNEDFTEEQFHKIGGTGVPALDLWSRWRVAGSNMEEFSAKYNLTDQRFIDALEGVIKEVEALPKPAFFTTPLTYILHTKGVPTEQIGNLIGRGSDMILTPFDLWVKMDDWTKLNPHGYFIEKFAADRGITDSALIEAIISIDSETESILFP